MGSLRIFLFLGLILHKLVWEVLKRRNVLLKDKKNSPVKLQIQFVKLIKISVLIFLVVQTLFLNLFPMFEQPYLARIIGTVIYSIGLALAITGRVQLGTNWVDLEDYQVIPKQSVVKSGIYRYIRHPIYSGDLLLLTGLELALNSWLILGVVAVFLVVIRQAVAEETLLSQKLPGYAEYCKQTKMFIPYIV